MKPEKKKQSKTKIRLTVDDLKRKQSVRATFRLPHQVIELLSVIAGQLGIKQKSLFDQLIEDSKILGQVAQEVQGYAGDKQDRQQKTFVISRRSLLSLNETAKQQKIPRDLLVEVSIKRLLPIIDDELARHKKRKVLLSKMKSYLQQGQDLLEEVGEQLGENDLLYEMIQGQVELAQRNISVVDTIVEKGKPMEDW
ncbi:MAG: hypothetical protein OEM02_13410 [Desulfobulbaceae bacterium]|nr:hypothetical protein [Desulfobulbaceae bacterium]